MSRRLLVLLVVLLGLLAVASLVRAEEESERDKEKDMWGVLQLKKQLRMHAEFLESLINRNKKCPSEKGKFINRKTLDIRDGRSLSYKDFFHHYAQQQKPVLIKNYISRITPKHNITTAYVREKCGDKKVWVAGQSLYAKTWGGLTGGKETTVRDFIDGIDAETHQLYLHDWPLPKNCPELLEDFVIPKYVAGDLIHRIPKERAHSHSYHQSWPSLFIGRKGTFSGLHVDSFGSNFWMVLLEGKKHWRFYPDEDRPLLYETPETQSFQVNAFNPDYDKFPLHAHARTYDIVLEPGDFLFVPGGVPHAVRNPEYSLAMSGNFVDRSNLDLVLEELSISAHSGYYGSELLFREFSSSGFPREPLLDTQRDMEWKSEFLYQDFGNWEVDGELPAAPVFVDKKATLDEEEAKTPMPQFDAIYLLSFDRLSKERDLALERMRAAGIDPETVTVWDAYDPRTFTDGTLDEMGIALYPNYEDPYYGSSGLEPKDAASFMSHQSVWKDVVAKGHQRVLVFEIDVGFEKRFKLGLTQGLKEAEGEATAATEGWDIIYLTRKLISGFYEDEKYVSTHLSIPGFNNWVVGYALSQRGAQRLVDMKVEKRIVPVDDLFNIIHGQFNTDMYNKEFDQNFAVYAINPKVCDPYKFPRDPYS